MPLLKNLLVFTTLLALTTAQACTQLATATVPSTNTLIDFNIPCTCTTATEFTASAGPRRTCVCHDPSPPNPANVGTVDGAFRDGRFTSYLFPNAGVYSYVKIVDGGKESFYQITYTGNWCQIPSITDFESVQMSVAVYRRE